MSDFDDSLDDLGLSALLDLGGEEDESSSGQDGEFITDDSPDTGDPVADVFGDDPTADVFGADPTADVFGDDTTADVFGDEAGSEDAEGASADGEGEEQASKKSTKKGKKKKKKDPEKTRVRVFLFLIFVIIVATAYFGFTLIKAASYLGILVIVAGLSLAIFLLVTNMVKLKLCERVKDRTKKSEANESVKLDEDMEKCRGRITALDERAAEWEKEHPPGGDKK